MTQAADSSGEFAIKGAGLQTCEAVVRAWDTRSDDLKLYIGWLDGYLTGMNQHFDATFDIAPWQSSATVLGISRQLCRERDGSSRLIDVVNELVRDFSPSRLQEKSNATVIRRGDQAAAQYSEIILRMKRRLVEEGFLGGDVDASFGEDTADALERFQEDRGLRVTGVPNQETFFALFMRPPS